MKIKNIAKFVVLNVLLITASSAYAGTAKGFINNNHLNSSINGRGVCFRMTPVVNGTGWLCLYKNNSLYSEINKLALVAYNKGKKCSVRWGSLDGAGHKIINLMDCGK